MTELLAMAALLLGLNLVVAVLGVLRHPGANDRMLSVQLLGTHGIGLILLLASSQAQHGLTDVALVLALLGAVVVIAFTRREAETSDD